MRKLMLVVGLLLLCSTFCLAAEIDPMVLEAMQTKQGLIPVIVQMHPDQKPVDVEAMGGKLGYTYTIINGFSAELPAAAINALDKNPNVSVISYDKEIQIAMNVAAQAVYAHELWAEGYDGSGVTIAFIDTGIAPHQDFQSRIIAFRDFVNGRTTPYDDNGHGTHCAGAAAGNGSSYDGPARAAKLVGIKVLDASGNGSISTMISGVNWCVTNKSTYGIKVLNFSIGGPISQSSTVDPLCTALRNAWNSGIVVCVAAGNDGPYSYSIGSPGNEPKVITVGAFDDRNTVSGSDDVVASFSSRGPTSVDGWTKPDILAPGVNITSCDNSYSGYVTMSGTSVACAIASGVMAQILEARPTWLPDTVKSNVKGSCINLGYNANTQGAGKLDAYYAVH